MYFYDIDISVADVGLSVKCINI